MEGIANLVKPVLESAKKNETLETLLRSCVDQRAFLKGNQVLVGEINARLNASTSRHEGLLLLNACLPQCSEDILVRNAALWMQFCLKAATVNKTAVLAFRLLGTLLKLSESVSEIGKHVSSNIVANLAESIHDGILPQAHLSALKCLEQCMGSYNGPCGPHRKVIEKYLYSLLDYSGYQQLDIFWQTACCMALLPQIGGGGVGGVQYKWAWAALQKNLCRTMHLILDDLYADSSELQVTLMGEKLETIEPLPLAPITEVDPVLRSQKLTSRFTAVSACLQAMLVNYFPVPKNVAASSIMSLICRGLAVNGPSLGTSNTSHCMALAADLPKVHYSLLKILEALLLMGGSNMLRYAGEICKLVIQTLKWTSVEGWPVGVERPFSYLREQAYEVLEVWCGIAKRGSGVGSIAQQFVELAICDIYVEKDTISLSGSLLRKNKHGSQKPPKRKSGQGVSNGSSSSPNCVLRDEGANKDVCVSALRAITALILSSSSKMQAELHKMLQETVVSILLKISPQLKENPIPYSLPTPRLEVYRLLLQLVLEGHPHWPAPTNIAMKLFSKGLDDQDVQVSMFCGMALSSLEKIIHPAHPSLHLQSGASALASPSVIYTSQTQSGDDNNEQEVTDAESMSQQNDQNLPESNSHADHGLSTLQSNVVSAAVLYTSTPSPGSPKLQPKGGLRVFRWTNQGGSGNIMNAEVVVEKPNDKTPEKPNDKTPEKTTAETSIKESPKSSEKRPSEIEERSIVTRQKLPTVDLTLTEDEDEEEICEVPCEVDLVDSDTESRVSLCSRTTVTTPDPKPAGGSVLEPTTQNSPKLIEPKEKAQDDGEPQVTGKSQDAEKLLDAEKSQDVGKFQDQEKLSSEKSQVEAESSEKDDNCAGNEISSTVASQETPIAKKSSPEVEEGNPNKEQDETGNVSMDGFDDDDAMLMSFVDVTRDEEDVEMD